MSKTRTPAPARSTVRCAVYTRKSTEEGLEQEFNSLDAQREAGAAYVKSQAHEGCADASDETTGRRFISNVPLLVVDDEADLASIDTRQQEFDEFGSPDLEHDPARINGLIR